MSAYKTYHNIFFAWNGPGPYECAWCEENVYPWWDEPDDINHSTTLAVHHVDEDRANSDPSNLAPMHHGCHTEYHRRLNPLVAKGSRLPEQWRQRIAAAQQRKLETWHGAVYDEWLRRVREGIHGIDRTPVDCPDCGDGPFQGAHGLSMHKRKSGCAEGRISKDLAKRQARAGLKEYYCKCGDGPFYSTKAVGNHKGWKGCNSGKARYTSPKEPVYCPDCGKGPFRTTRSITIHKGMTGCGSPLAMD